MGLSNIRVDRCGICTPLHPASSSKSVAHAHVGSPWGVEGVGGRSLRTAAAAHDCVVGAREGSVMCEMQP